MSKRIYRSRVNCKIAGVCGGIAEYFNIDPVIPRLLAILLLFADGAGLVAYIIAWIIIPKYPLGETEPVIEPSQSGSFWHSVWPGAILVGLGVVFLLNQFVWWFDFEDFVWPALIIAVGAFLIYNSTSKEKENDDSSVKIDEVK